MLEFNPKKIEKVEKINISLRLEEPKIKLIDKLSFQRNISRNEFLVQCIDFALEHLTQNEKKGEE